MDIICSANNNEEIVVLPVVPPLETIVNSIYQNEVFTAIDGEINLIGNQALKTLEIASFFPTHKYPWIKQGANANGWNYVDFFEKWQRRKVPIRIIITTKYNREVLNMAVTIDSFTYTLDEVGDIQYTLSLKEYKFVQVKKV